MGASKRKWYESTSFFLHILAMLLMLSDHAWSMLFPSYRWMTSLGRIAFPIFAFMIVEGFFHTHDITKYIKRMFLFALISEIPFNLMMSGTIIAPFHQNVMWTFLIAICGMRFLELIKGKYPNKKIRVFILSALIVLGCFILGFVAFVDYYGTGILMVFTFYFFHERKWYNYIAQFLVLYWLNVELLGGYCFYITVFGMQFEIVEQGLALLSLIPIWLYQGKQGYHARWFQYFCYAFYPAHMLVLFLAGYFLN